MLILLCYILINRIFASEASNGSAVAIVIETNVSALYQTRIPSLQPSLIPIFRPFNFSEGEGVISFNKSQHNQSVTVGEIDVSSNKTEDSRSHIPTNQPSFVAYKLDLDVPTQFPSPTVENQTSQPSQTIESEKPTIMGSTINMTGSLKVNMSTNVTINIKENSTLTQPASWYNYFSSSKPSYSPTNQPSVVLTEHPTTEPTIEPSDFPTYASTEKSNNSATSSNDNQNNYELISSMTAIISIVIIAVAFFITKKHLLKKKKHRTNIVFRSPLLFDMSKRAKQRKKLMEDYFEVEATENTLQHRSAASSLDHQISTEFIDITRENQQSIY